MTSRDEIVGREHYVATSIPGDLLSREKLHPVHQGR